MARADVNVGRAEVGDAELSAESLQGDVAFPLSQDVLTHDPSAQTPPLKKKGVKLWLVLLGVLPLLLSVLQVSKPLRWSGALESRAKDELPGKQRVFDETDAVAQPESLGATEEEGRAAVPKEKKRTLTPRETAFAFEAKQQARRVRNTFLRMETLDSRFYPRKGAFKHVFDFVQDTISNTFLLDSPLLHKALLDKAHASLKLEDRILDAVKCFSAAVQLWERLGDDFAIKERARLMQLLWDLRSQEYEEARTTGAESLPRHVEVPDQVEEALDAYIEAQEALEDLKSAYEYAAAANIATARVVDQVVAESQKESIIGILRENQKLYDLEKHQSTACQFFLEYIFFSGKPGPFGSSELDEQEDKNAPSAESEWWNENPDFENEIAEADAAREAECEVAAQIASASGEHVTSEDRQDGLLLPPRVVKHVLADVKRIPLSPRYARYGDDL